MLYYYGKALCNSKGKLITDNLPRPTKQAGKKEHGEKRQKGPGWGYICTDTSRYAMTTTANERMGGRGNSTSSRVRSSFGSEAQGIAFLFFLIHGE